MDESPMSGAQAPVATRRAHPHEAFGEIREDDWYWLRNRDDPETIAYLEAENVYAESVLAPTASLQEALYEGIRSRVEETDAGPASWNAGWWWYTRTIEGSQYPLHCRYPDPARALHALEVAAQARARRAGEAGEQVLLDENELVGHTDFLEVGVFDVSPDGSLLAYATDFDGSELYTLRFRDLRSGVDLPDVVERVYYGSAWTADGSQLLYVRPDEAMRPWQVWRHVLGTEPAVDEMIYQEDDERFFVDVELTRSLRRILVHSESKTTSEVRWLDAAAPSGDLRTVLVRSPGVEYSVDDDGSGWLVLANLSTPQGESCPNFALYRLDEDRSDTAGLLAVLAHRASVRIESFECFEDFVAVFERWEDDALVRLRILGRDGSDRYVEQPEQVYTLAGEPNPQWAATTYRYGYTSLVTPAASLEYGVRDGAIRQAWAQVVPGGYDPTRYRTARLWAEAGDGTRVPVSVVARSDVPADGTAPCLLYGYGAYEISIDPAFSPARLNLLERGVVFAIAHVRGGGERGRRWYEQGRMQHKVNSFTDLIAVAEDLIRSRWADPARIAIRGASAGGLLVGAAINMRPDLWRAVVAEVPFVDPVTTMSDVSLPLTVTEWEEWGDPLHDEEAYRRMRAYSPYDNVEASVRHPAIYATGGLNDPRVGFWEPAKWVARLRSVGAGHDDRPVLLRTELGSGHQGPSGRYDAWRDEVRVQAFLLMQWGLA